MNNIKDRKESLMKKIAERIKDITRNRNNLVAAEASLAAAKPPPPPTPQPTPP